MNVAVGKGWWASILRKRRGLPESETPRRIELWCDDKSNFLDRWIDARPSANDYVNKAHYSVDIAFQ